MWYKVFTAKYRDNATIATEHNGTDVCLRLRRVSGQPYEEYVMTPNQAIAMAYALLKAQQMQEVGILEDRDNE